MEEKMKKKIALFLVAALLLGAGLIMSCGGDDDPVTKKEEDGKKSDPAATGPYSITFNANGGKFADGETSKVVQTGANGKVTFPDDPTNGYVADLFGQLDDEFLGWFDEAAKEVLSTKVFTEDTTLKAKWDRWTEPGFGDKTVPLGYFTWTNAETQRGWYSNGADGKDTDLDWDDVTFARYLVLETKNKSAVNNFGEIQIVFSGSIVGGWKEVVKTSNLTYTRGTDTVWLVFELRDFKDNYLKFVRGTPGKFLIAYYTPDLSGFSLQEVYLTNVDLSEFAGDEADTTLEAIKDKDSNNICGFVTKADLGLSSPLVSAKTIDFDMNGGGTNPANIQVSSGKSMGLLYPGVKRNGHDFLGWFTGSATTLTLANQEVAGFDLATTIATWGTEYKPTTAVTTDLSLKAGWKEQAWPADPAPAAIANYTKIWTVISPDRLDLDPDNVSTDTIYRNPNATGQLEIGNKDDPSGFRAGLLAPIKTAQTASKSVTLRIYGARPSSSSATGGWNVLEVKDGGWGGTQIANLPFADFPAAGSNAKAYIDYVVPTLTGGEAPLILNPNNGIILQRVECWIQN